jgi:hypothetical protein
MPIIQMSYTVIDGHRVDKEVEHTECKCFRIVCEGIAIPLQTLRGPWGSRNLRFPD